MDQNENQSIPNTAVPATPEPPKSTPLGANQTTPKTSSQNYFARVYSGRLNRRNYIIGSIPIFVIYVLLESLLNPTLRSQVGVFGQILFNLITLVVTIFVLFLYGLPLAIRRLHDLNKTGWLLLLNFIPFVNLIFGLYILFFPGTKGENKYGSQPLPRIDIKQDILRL